MILARAIATQLGSLLALAVLIVTVAETANWIALGIIYLTPETLSGRYLLVMWITL